MTKIFTPDSDGEYSFGHVIEFAESIGWVDPDLLTGGEWTPCDCDSTEDSAIDFIKSKGFVFMEMEEL